MGFFKDLNEKDSNSKEITNDEVIETTDTSEEVIDDLFNVEEILNQKDAEEYDLIEQIEDEEVEDNIDPELLGNLFNEEIVAEEEVVEEEAVEEEVIEEKPIARQATRNEDTSDDRNATTVITKGTTINGSIISDCSLDVMGTINGDIECIGKLSISGNVVGNSIASEVFINTKRLEGNVDSEGSVKIALGTVVIGDIKAGSAVIAGAVKGELDVTGPVILDSTAIIKGNIKAKSVQMNNGAVLEGFCSLSYSSVSIDDIFE